MKCPRTTCKNKAIIDPSYGVLPCKKCTQKDKELRERVNLDKRPDCYTLSQHTRRTKDRDDHGKDIIQPWLDGGMGKKPNPEFIKHYPQMRDTYFTKDQLMKI